MNLISAFLSFFLEYASLTDSYQQWDCDQRLCVRWRDHKGDAGLRQSQEIGREFSLEVAAKDGVAFFRGVAIQTL
jgi:hypothetical protein